MSFCQERNTKNNHISQCKKIETVGVFFLQSSSIIWCRNYSLSEVKNILGNDYSYGEIKMMTGLKKYLAAK